MLEKRYLDYALVLKRQFSERVQKISINAGFTCPNRNGEKGIGGCTYCNNQSFLPEYCRPQKSITQQLEEGILFFHHKYQSQKYLAYFQSYTNTYGTLSHLKNIYEEALRVPNVVGIVIGTRPDCVSDALLDYLADIAKEKYVMIEYGIESTSNKTLNFINRGHNYEDAVIAIEKTAKRDILTCAHLILGLPNESKSQLLLHANELSKLPINVLKLHQLQIVKGTRMAEQFKAHPEWFSLFSAEEYIDLVIDFLERLNPNIAIERFISQSPKELLLAPDWGLKNFEFVAKIDKRMQQRNAFQGRLFNTFTIH